MRGILAKVVRTFCIPLGVCLSPQDRIDSSRPVRFRPV